MASSSARMALVLTIGYLVTEAEEVTLIANDGRKIPAHVLGYDGVTGFGLVHALEPTAAAQPAAGAIRGGCAATAR